MIDFAAVGLSAIAAIAVGASAICIRLGTDDGNANDAIIIAILINAVIFTTVALTTTPWSYRPTTRALLAFIGAGLIGTMIGRALFFHGIDRVGASRAEPVKASTPLHATILAVLILGETLTSGHLLGVVAIVIGIALISHESSRHSTIGGEEFSVIALWLPLAAAVAYGIEPIFAKTGFADDTPLFVALAIKSVAAAIGFFIYLRWKGVVPTISSIHRGALKWYLLAGLVNSMFQITYYLALIIAPVALVVPIVQMSPLFVAIVGYLYLQHLERVTPRLIAGALIVVGGGILVTLYG